MTKRGKPARAARYKKRSEFNPLVTKIEHLSWK